MRDTENRKRLMEIVKQDDIYQFWLHCYGESAKAFDAIIQKYPPEEQNILRNHENTLEMLYQKIVLIACDKMEFIDEK